MITLYPSKMPKWMTQMYCIVLCTRLCPHARGCAEICIYCISTFIHVSSCFIMFQCLSQYSSTSVMRADFHASHQLCTLESPPFQRLLRPFGLVPEIQQINEVTACDSTNLMGKISWNDEKLTDEGAEPPNAKLSSGTLTMPSLQSRSPLLARKQNIQIFAAFWSNLYQRFAWNSALISNLLHWVTWRKHEDPEVAATKPPPTKNSRLSCPL